MKALSICVPTFNRKPFLDRLIRNVLKETAGSRGAVELCISDNASTDGTEQMVRAHMRKHPFIRYQRNEENLGGDRNVIAVISMSSAKHCWLIGDDDYFERGAISEAMRILRKDPDYVIPGFRRPNEARKPRKAVEVLPGTPEWVRLAGDIWNTSYIGSHILRREIAFSVRDDMRKGRGFPHLAMFFHSRLKCRSIILAQGSFIVQESDGIYPTSERIAAIFFDQLPSLLAHERKAKVLTAAEYDAAMGTLRPHLLYHLLPACTVVFKSTQDLRRGQRILLDGYRKHIKGSEDDTLPVRAYFLIARTPLFTPFAIGVKIAFELFYVRMLNPLRKHKVPSPWTLQRSAKKTGAREQLS